MHLLPNRNYSLPFHQGVVVEFTGKLPRYSFIVIYSPLYGNARPIIRRTNEKSGLLAK